MAMFHEYGPDRNEIRKAFDDAAAKGQSHLLILNEVLEDTYNVTVMTYTKGIEKPEDTYGTIEMEQSEKRSYARIQLSHALDVKRDFNEQMDLWHKGGYARTLPTVVVADLHARQEKKALEQKRAAWDRQPFLARLFSTRP